MVGPVSLSNQHRPCISDKLQNRARTEQTEHELLQEDKRKRGKEGRNLKRLLEQRRDAFVFVNICICSINTSALGLKTFTF